MINQVEKALLQAFYDQCFLEKENVAFENVNFEVPEGVMWASIFFVPSLPEVDELGECGSDRLEGFLQIDLNTPVGDGSGEIKDKANEIRQFFTAGKYFDYEGQAATIKSCGISQGRYVDNFYRLVLTINFYAFIQRALQQ